MSEADSLVIKGLKILVGDVPLQWLRLILLGGFLVWLGFAMRDFKQEVKNEALQVRGSLESYVAANTAWQSLTLAERARLLKKVNARFRRLYSAQGWEYEEVEP